MAVHHILQQDIWFCQQKVFAVIYLPRILYFKIILLFECLCCSAAHRQPQDIPVLSLHQTCRGHPHRCPVKFFTMQHLQGPPFPERPVPVSVMTTKMHPYLPALFQMPLQVLILPVVKSHHCRFLQCPTTDSFHHPFQGLAG